MEILQLCGEMRFYCSVMVAFSNRFGLKVSDALIKKVLDQVDDGINFGESAQSPKGSPKLNRRPGGNQQRTNQITNNNNK